MWCTVSTGTTSLRSLTGVCNAPWRRSSKGCATELSRAAWSSGVLYTSASRTPTVSNRYSWASNAPGCARASESKSWFSGSSSSGSSTLGLSRSRMPSSNVRARSGEMSFRDSRMNRQKRYDTRARTEVSVLCSPLHALSGYEVWVNGKRKTHLASTMASSTGMMHSLRTLKKSAYRDTASKNCITTALFGYADTFDCTNAKSISPWGVNGKEE